MGVFLILSLLTDIHLPQAHSKLATYSDLKIYLYTSLDDS